MHLSPGLGLRLPDLTGDPPDVPLWMDRLATDLESRLANKGTLANRPTSTPASPGYVGRRYFAYDDGPNGTEYLDTGTSWVAIGPTVTADGSITNAKLATDAVDSRAIAADAVGASELADNAVDTAAIVDKAVTILKLADALKPSAGAGAGTEALRALGTAAGQAAAGSHGSQHALAGADPLPADSVGAAQVKDGTLTNAEIAAAAAIAYSKLNLAGSIAKADLATSALQAFPQLATPAARKIAFGGATLPFGGSTSLATVSVAHGLGATPVNLQVTSNYGLNSGLDVHVQTWDATNFTIRGVASGNLPDTFVFWLAIG